MGLEPGGRMSQLLFFGILGAEISTGRVQEN